MNALAPVSVIIPVYNHEKYVIQALDSVFNQTHPSLEIIIIDDGSKDESAAYIENYLKNYTPSSKKKREFLFLKETNKGAAHTINQGLALAKHDILTILNSDDYFAPDRLEWMIRTMRQENSEIAFSEVIGIDEAGAPLPSHHRWSSGYDFSLSRHHNYPSNSFAFLAGNIAISTGNLIFTRKLLEEIGPFKNYLHAHDYEFILRAILYYEPLFLRKGFYFYRMHSSNTITQNLEITEMELSQFLPDFLLAVTAEIPKNRQCPSPWTFPTEFAKLRETSGIDRYLSRKIEISLPPLNVPCISTNDVAVKSNPSFSKVTFITHQLSFSGAPKVAYDLALVLKSKGYLPNILSFSDGPLKAHCEKSGIPVSVIPDQIQFEKQSSFYAKIRALIGSYFYLLRNVHRTVIVNSFASRDVGFLLGLIPFLKRYWYIHESVIPSIEIRESFKKFGMRLLTDSKKYFFLFGSKSTQALWNRSNVKGKVVYWSGIPSSPSPKRGLRPIKNILAMGSIEVRKGAHILIEAFIQCIQQNRVPQDVILTIVGFPEKIQNPYQGDLVLRIMKEKLQSRIRLTRAVPIDRIDNLFEEADLFAMASSNECLPLVLLKAMSKGLPIITTTANGCAEAIENDVSGYTCSQQNPDAFACILEKAVNNPATAWKMGQAAHQRFNAQFSLEHNIREFMKEF